METDDLDVQQLVPFCVHAMGAKSLKPIYTTSETVNLAVYDIVLIESRSKAHVFPQVWLDSGKLCNFGWLKHCVVSMGREWRHPLTSDTDSGCSAACRGSA